MHWILELELCCHSVPGKASPVCVLLSRLLQAEQNYNVGDLELLTIKFVLEEWRHWVDVPTTVCGRVIQGAHSCKFACHPGKNCTVSFMQRFGPRCPGFRLCLPYLCAEQSIQLPFCWTSQAPAYPQEALVAHRTGLHKWAATILM